MSQPKKTKNTLSESSFFEYLPKNKLSEILKISQTLVLPPKSVIFRQGDTGDSFYIIFSGKVKAFRTDENGVEMELGVLGAGDVFGELALLTGNPRPASAETIEKTVLCVLTKKQFDQILKDYPLVTLSFVHHISKVLIQDWEAREEESKKRYQAPRISGFDFALIFTMSIICALLFNFANSQGIRLIQETWSEDPIAAITPIKADQEFKKGDIIFVDARPRNFYEQKHIKGALSLPADLFDIAYLMILERIDRAQKLIVYGQTISSLYNRQVAEKIRLRGHTNVSILAGDLPAWEKGGYPTEP